MKTQIVYALASTPGDLFFEELWASVYSLRLYEPDRDVKVFCDERTSQYIRKYPEFVNLLTEIVCIPISDNYNKWQRSRAIKTSIRQKIQGNFLYVDTDTIFAGTLEFIDNLTCDVAAVAEYHVALSHHLYRHLSIKYVKDIFDEDISDAKRQHNGGVIYAADSKIAHELYKRWNDNWHYSAFKKGNNSDQPSLMKSDKDMGYIIQELPGEYNCQMAMSIEHFFEAKIIHFLHFDLLPQPQNPFLDKSLYRKIKEDGGISETTAYTIHHCKTAFISPSAIVDGRTIEFLLSNPGHVFMTVAKQGGLMLSIMNKIAAVYAFWLKHKHVKIW